MKKTSLGRLLFGLVCVTAFAACSGGGDGGGSGGGSASNQITCIALQNGDETCVRQYPNCTADECFNFQYSDLEDLSSGWVSLTAYGYDGQSTRESEKAAPNGENTRSAPGNWNHVYFSFQSSGGSLIPAPSFFMRSDTSSAGTQEPIVCVPESYTPPNYDAQIEKQGFKCTTRATRSFLAYDLEFFWPTYMKVYLEYDAYWNSLISYGFGENYLGAYWEDPARQESQVMFLTRLSLAGMVVFDQSDCQAGFAGYIANDKSSDPDYIPVGAVLPDNPANCAPFVQLSRLEEKSWLMERFR